MKNKKSIITIILGAISFAWFAILIAPYFENGLIYALTDLSEILQNPFNLRFSKDTIKSLVIFETTYFLGLCVYISTKKNYKRKIEYGSASFGDPQKLKSKYSSKDSFNNRILTQNCSLDIDDRVHKRNLNVLVVGGSGAGKTRYYCKPNILQCNSSIVVLDPKGEMVRSSGTFLKEQHYEVKVLDLINMEKSHCYNPFAYLKTDSDVQRLVSNIFSSTAPKDSKTGDPFWNSSAENLLTALILYLKYEAPDHEKNFSTIMKMLDVLEIDEKNPDSTNAIDNLFERLEMQYEDHIAVRYYRTFRSGAGETIKSIKQTLLSRIGKFNLEDLQALTHTDELKLDSLGKKKQALFIVIPDNDTSLNFIASVLYTQLFQQLFRVADSLPSGRLPVPCHIIMDEFANVALPNDFCKILSVMRSRGISASIILQNLSQLKELFKEQFGTIIGNCDTFLYLGSNETTTLKYVCEMLGKETIDLNTFTKQKGTNSSLSTNFQITGRDLMTVDEIRCLDNKYALLFLRGEKPIRDLKYQFEKHPNFLKTKNTIFEYGIENLPAIQMEVVQNEDFSEDIVDERLYNENCTVEILTEEDF